MDRWLRWTCHDPHKVIQVIWPPSAGPTFGVPTDKFRTWCWQQYPILNYETRSFALMMSRAAHQDEKKFCTMLLEGAQEAEACLERTAEGLGVSFADLTNAALLPHTQAYGHYLAWLGWYGTPGQQAAAATVNLPTYA